MWRLVAASAAVLALGSCGGESDEASTERSAVRAISGSVELERPRAGAPDAGTAAGHGADVAVATTRSSRFMIPGRLAPASSRLVLRDARTGRRTPVPVERSGRFAAEARGLRPGRTSFRLAATKPGYRPWTVEVRITRAP